MRHGWIIQVGVVVALVAGVYAFATAPAAPPDSGGGVRRGMRSSVSWEEHRAAEEWRRGDREGSIARLRRVVRADPGRAEVWRTLGHRLRAMGLEEDAIEAWEQAAGAFEARSARRPGDWQAPYELGWTLRLLDQQDAARAAFAHAAAIHYRKMIASPGAPERDPVAWYNHACYTALAGDPDTAVEAFERSVEAGWEDARWPRVDRDLESVRDDPRFREALERIPVRPSLAAPIPSDPPEVRRELIELLERHGFHEAASEAREQAAPSGGGS